MMSFKYNAEDSVSSFPEGFAAYTLEGDLHAVDERKLVMICPSLVGPSSLLPTNEEIHTAVHDNIAVPIYQGDGVCPVDQINGYFFPYYPWVALEEGRIHPEQSPSGCGMKSHIYPCNADSNQQVEMILFHQQTAQSSGTGGHQECTLMRNDEVHVEYCHDDCVLREGITDSDSENSVMSSQFFCKTDRSCRRDNVTLTGPAETSGESRNSKCSQSFKTTRKRRGECREELECIPKRCRMDTKVGYTPQMLSKVVEVTTETIQVAPSCGQVVEVLRRSTIGRGRDIVHVQNEATPWEPWVTALQDEGGTLIVSPCSSRTSLIKMDDSMQNVKKDEVDGGTKPILEQRNSCETKEASLCMQVKGDFDGTTCHQVFDSHSEMLPSLNKNVDINLNQMLDDTFDSCIVADAPDGSEKTLVDDNFSDQSLDSMILFEELKDFTSEEIVPQDIYNIGNDISTGFLKPENHSGKVLNDRTVDVSCGIDPKQRHIQDKLAFLLTEAEKELKKMGIRGFSVRLNIDWHQLVVKDFFFGNTFVFPLDEIDFNDRQPIFEDVLERLTKDMYMVQSCATKARV